MRRNIAPTTVLLLTLLSGSFAPQTRAGSLAPELESPRLRVLAGQLEAGNEGALAEFWKRVEEETAPLIEPIEGDDGYVWLTVLWRGVEDTENVLLVGALVRGNDPGDLLDNLPGTDLWFRTYRSRTDLRATYRLSPNDPLSVVPMDDLVAVQALRKNYRRDPLNQRKPFMGASLIELADAPEQSWIEANPNVPKGEVTGVSGFKSEVLGNERRIDVYLPPDYNPSATPYPMLLVFDRLMYSRLIPTSRILDNLIDAKEILPMIAVLVGNAGGARNDELPCNDQFVQFLAEELVPWVRDDYNVSTDPAKNVIAGASFGGLASSYAAFRHPELFGNVISQSGSYWWSPETNSSVLARGVEGEWLTRQFAASEKKAIRFFIEIGLNEGGRPSMVIVNRHFRDVLLAKGYEIVRYDEFNGGHEILNWRGSLADALIALVGE